MTMLTDAPAAVRLSALTATDAHLYHPVLISRTFSYKIKQIHEAGILQSVKYIM